MIIEIWSDIMCPFCYIGKRRFEEALSKFEHSNEVEIHWKSFLLNPNMETDPSKSTYQYLAENKGWTLDYTKQVSQQVTAMAKEVGLTYDFDKTVVANAMDAHRLIQLAKNKGLGDEMEERLFKAYFTEGKNIADLITLTQLGIDIGLNPDALSAMLNSNQYTQEVQNDIAEAQAIGVKGVPFFVINRQYAVSGAQASETFLNALNQAWETAAPATKQQDTAVVCNTDGNC